MRRSLPEKWSHLTERVDFPREVTDNNNNKTKVLTDLGVLWAKLKMPYIMQYVNSNKVLLNHPLF